MHAFVVGLVADEVNPATQRPVPMSGLVFTVVALATALLLVSMVRHLRRVANSPLPDDSPPARGPGGQPAARAAVPDAGPAAEPPAEPGDPVAGGNPGPAGAGTGPTPEGDGPA